MQRKTFKYIVIRQLLSNGMHSPDLSPDVMLSELIDIKGLLTTLIVLESDYQMKKKKVEEQLSEIASQATKITAMDTRQQEFFQTVPMAEFSWHMMYNSDIKTYLEHVEKSHPHNISVLRSYLSLNRPLEILGAY